MSADLHRCKLEEIKLDFAGLPHARQLRIYIGTNARAQAREDARELSGLFANRVYAIYTWNAKLGWINKSTYHCARDTTDDNLACK